MKHIQRTIKKVLVESIKHRPITLVTGARQVGKSTLCYELKEELGFDYVSLDDTRDRMAAITDPWAFIAAHKLPLIVDEVQYAPMLLEVIESVVNKAKLEKGENNGMFLLTGSQTYELMKGVSQSMAGRVGIVRMSPLSVSEVRGIEERKFKVDPDYASERAKSHGISYDELFEFIVNGLYPGLYDGTGLSRESFYSDYVNSYLQRDVTQLMNIKDQLKFQRFLEIIASMTGCELIYDKIAKVIGVKSDTIQSWVSILSAGEIIYLLEPYNDASIIKRVVKRPKIYFSDTGLACYLARLSDKEVLKASHFSGAFVETYMVNEIRKSYRNNGINPNLFYYRDSNQNEIDLVILENGELSLIECKSGASFSLKDVSSFKQLSSSSYKIGKSCIISSSEKVYPLSEDIFVLPVSSI